MKKLIIAIFYLTLLSPLLKAQTTENHVRNINNETEMKSQFAIIILNVSKKDNLIEINPLQSKLIDGIYKKPPFVINSGKENDLVCFILNQNNQPIDSLFINNPLINRLEYSEDEKTISSVIIDKVENEVMIRFNYTNEMKYLQFKKMEKDGKLITINSLPLILN